MNCPECDRLTEEFERLERVYCSVIEALTKGRKSAPGRPFKALRTTCDDARRDSEMARLELLKHQEIHRKAN
jgi:hypothetical protein